MTSISISDIPCLNSPSTLGYLNPFFILKIDLQLYPRIRENLWERVISYFLIIDCFFERKKHASCKTFLLFFFFLNENRERDFDFLTLFVETVMHEKKFFDFFVLVLQMKT